ncbi:MAG: 30S ribosomal protein S21 [Proteobacteria bacterium]|jgi:ribosomal protein S21|nr:30S ribosomal protein S21 [Pseudomonadota bacterium]
MAVNCRAILRVEHGKSPEENFRNLLGKFRKKTTDSGVMTLWKSKQYFESKGERRRRKEKAAQMKRIKANRPKTV